MVCSGRTINYQVRIHGYINRIEQFFIYLLKSLRLGIIYMHKTNMNSQVMRVCIFLSGLYYSA